ncbi:DNA gyrase subunit A [Rhizomicrobium electricum]|uniref:DNA gyrase subunit A n=1 Tax=Rhizomicrobium electricum TaxID=480070 RepID=A0ABN1EBA3_9PROT|nr:DNA gyrase subunit A [Rhizomicrobium electricum]NIJ48137.1 DNA gyrase subunit A [Rhizomicrobium electricum]
MSDTSVPTPPSSGSSVSPTAIEDELKRSYLDYAMSVIVARALPDARDGLKPVHRRILFSMHENNRDWNKPFRKSALIVGDVMGKYHPHGDSSIYDALVRMAQPFSMRVPLVDGQGNFGSVDGDPPAAMRYTEARRAKVAHTLTEDIDKDTVEYQPNYDGSEREPIVLPARYPNLLVNGASGIAVGMATNIPPHNLGEIIDACLAYMDDPGISMDALTEIVPGPDFPTGGLIIGKAAARSALARGRGSILMRAKCTVEEIRKDREAIIVHEIPYQVNKARMQERMAELVRDKRVEGISDIRDESDRHGMRVVIELKRDASAEVVLNQLYRFSDLQTSFGVNMLAINDGRPQQMNLKELIGAFVTFREEVVTRRTRFELAKARDRAHILAGLAVAVANIDEVIALIRRAPDAATAKVQLMERAWPARDVAPLVMLVADPRHQIAEDGTIHMSEEQAKAILELRLQRLTALGRDEIGDEVKKLGEAIKDYLDILRSRPRVLSIIQDELKAVRDEYATPRLTELVDAEVELEDEALIEREDVAITVTHAGYIKRTPLAEYRVQGRGGKGRAGMATREEDFVTSLFVASTHAPMVFFSSNGMAYKLKVWRLPEARIQGKGKALVNLLPMSEGERIATILPLPEDESQWEKLNVVFATKSGNVRRNELSDFVSINKSGKIAMKLEAGDGIVGVSICTDRDDVLLTTKLGKCIRFPLGDIRVFKGRESTGVRGIKLADGDEVVSLTLLTHSDASSAEARAYLKQASAARRALGEELPSEDAPADETEEGGEDVVLTQERFAAMGANEQFVLAVSENGFGKRTSSYEYRVTGRGGSGIVAMGMGRKNSAIIAAFPVEESDDLMLISNAGQTIRVPVGSISVQGRSAQGVTVFRVDGSERVVSVERIVAESDDSA